MTGHWLLLPVIGVVFVMEALSNIIQIGYFKFSHGKRVFKRAPLHNHLELSGWAETQIVTRAWLVDVSPLAPGDVIGVDALDDIDLEPGDAVLFHTGHGARWSDPDAYLEGEPGPGLELAEHLAAHGVALTGCDTWSYGPVPPEDPSRPFEVPQTLNVHHGVFVVENLDTSALAADGVREFALVLTHAKLRGATGAWVSPIALV